MSNHLKTARDWGSQKALEAVGYKTAEEVQRDAEELGLIEKPKTAAAPDALTELFRSIQK